MLMSPLAVPMRRMKNPQMPTNTRAGTIQDSSVPTQRLSRRPLKLDPGSLQIGDEGGIIELHRDETLLALAGVPRSSRAATGPPSLRW